MVKVIGTSRGRDASFSNGTAISIKDGHLLVFDIDGTTIAIFSPETWQDAVLEQGS